MGTHSFNIPLFREQFPAFTDPIAYPDATLTAYWDVAILYVNSMDSCLLNGDALQYAINAMTAHLAYLTPLIIAGEKPGFETDATIDKISVAIMPPPVSNFWNFWLSSSPYGQALLAFLRVQTAGGLMTGGLPEISAIRKIGGIF